MVYVAIKPYSNGYVRYFGTEKSELQRMYNAIKDFTEDAEFTTKVVIWAILANIGDTFETEYFEVEIVED